MTSFPLLALKTSPSPTKNHSVSSITAHSHLITLRVFAFPILRRLLFDLLCWSFLLKGDIPLVRVPHLHDLGPGIQGLILGISIVSIHHLTLSSRFSL